MPGTWFGLETARRGMKLNQYALEITGHNLANASTTGYSRQEAVINPTDPFTNPSIDSSVTPGQFGTGVEVSSIRRVKDEYLDNNVRRSTTDSAYWDDQISVLQRAEASFAEPASDGIGERITSFFKAWMDLNNTPQDPGVKAAVAQAGDSLATLMTYTYNQLGDVQNSVAVIDSTPAVTGGMLKDQVDEANNLLVQIRDLTDSIKKVYAVGQQPNDLLDKRDQLLEELSKFGPLDVAFETVNGKPTGELTKLTLFGKDLSQTGTKLDLVTDGTKISLKVNGGTDNGAEVNLTDNCLDTNQGGSLLGLERARQDVIDYKEKLNDIAINMKSMIAGIGIDFFEGDLSTGDFKVNPGIIQNPASINGTLAGSVADLRDSQIDPADKPYTFEQYYSLLVTQVGGNAKGASDMADNQTAIKTQITALRDSVSGVSTDEELTKMIQFQYGFQASARVINVLDEMLDLLINGLVGR
ncbi:flagellar hook-associated protein FlgK [Pelotomaculum propionicicum]|uniref:Flagellar hook-associated protein 1 n=1 Tax=Pelotomaculum propionicicum TaxID=258475 RepID=A0A4Y7RQA6_9FIRM|nr:flagellar hook-associated protein FlgK [Pelotomaculum propionicicum]NLI13195.1 flagellar hook-associated protein FlgK [Peptococcaceae bacterium]TEB11175.1 Flagellar hook-associated protein 1 [Pelotomaculum propionicicum]